MKSYLFILQQPPFASPLAEEAIELILAISAFEQEVSIIFKDDGVLQLIKSEGVTKTVSGLHLFEINDIYAEAGSLKKHSLKAAELSLKTEIIDNSKITQLIATHDVVISI